MYQFTCPKCRFVLQTPALYLSGGKLWWHLRPDRSAAFAAACRQAETRAGGAIHSCASLQGAIDSWLQDGAGGGPPALTTPATAESTPGAAAEPPDGDVGAAAIASASCIVEARGEVSGTLPPEVSGHGADPDKLAFFRSNPGSAEVRCFTLNDAVLLPGCAALLHRRQIVAETKYLFDEADYQLHRRHAAELVPAPPDQTVVLGFNGGYGNYYHWMMQCLPAIYWSLRNAGAADCLLALPPLSAAQEETLALLGLAGMPRLVIRFDRHYHFPRVLYCEFLNGRSAFHVSPAGLNLLNAMAAQVDQPQGTPERVYIARRDSINRVIDNEAEVQRLLERYGFVSVMPGEYPVRDQIRLFRGARIIAGGHGAGLTNIAFCRPHTTIIELLQSSYLNASIVRIAQGMNLRYFGECFVSETAEEIHRSRWRVDLGRLEARVRSVLATPA